VEKAFIQGIKYPIIQCPLGGLSTRRLTAMVSDLGGLGSFGAHGLSPTAINEVIAEIHELTTKPFAMNLWVSTEDEGASAYGKEQFARSLKYIAGHIEAWAHLSLTISLMLRSGLKTRYAFCSMQRYPSSASSSEYRRRRSWTDQLIEELNRLEAEILPYPLQRILLRNLSIPAEKAGRAERLQLWTG
jgi:NAD(P)H-dependent flavin oxidoreductase YrpB (nitropropane dioxygenase family)